MTWKMNRDLRVSGARPFMRGVVVAGVALALVSCKAELARSHRAGGDPDAGVGGGPASGGTDGSGGAPGSGGMTTAASGGSGPPDAGVMGSGGMPQAPGGMIGSGGAAPGGTTGSGAASAGGMTGSGGMGTGGAAGGSPHDAGADVPLDAAGDAPTDAVDAAPPPCTPMDTRCAAQGMQTCGSNGTWGAAAACESTICSGTKCLPKAAILIVSSSAVFTYDAVSGAFASTFPLGDSGIGGATIGPDGKLWVTVILAKSIVRYDLSGASLGVFTTTQDYSDWLAFGPDGNLYASARTSPRESIVRIDAKTGASLGTFVQGPLDVPVDGMAFHNGSLFVTYAGTGALGGSLYQYDGTTGAQVAQLYDSFSPYGPNTPAFAPDGTLYVPVWQSPDIAKFDGTTLKFVSNISRDSLLPTSIAFAPDGTLLVLSDPGPYDSVLRYDPKNGTFTTLVSMGSGGLGRARFVFYR